MHFGTASASHVHVVSATKITARSPSHGASSVHVTVTTPGGTSVSHAADVFTFFRQPRIKKIKPSHGSTDGGTKVTITGKALSGTTHVHFGSKAASKLHIKSATKITVVAPKHAKGVVDITVTTPGGTSDTVKRDHFSFN